MTDRKHTKKSAAAAAGRTPKKPEKKPPKKPDIRCGFVAICGRPNAGKSTLVNRFVGEQVAIVSPRPQTTRNRITGIFNGPDAQVVFLDTPGLIEGATGMNEYLMKTARAAVAEADATIYLVDASEACRDPAHPAALDLANAAVIKDAGKPSILVLNKVDLVKNKALLLPLIERWSAAGVFQEIVPVSAGAGNGCDELLAAITARIPLGERLFPDDYWSDLPEKFFVAELVRESIFRHLYQELPYSSAVVVEEFDEASRGDGFVRIRADIHIEKESQKAIIIGKGGAMLKAIGTDARLAIERFLQARVHLELHVVVTSRWTRDPVEMKRLGYFVRDI